MGLKSLPASPPGRLADQLVVRLTRFAVGAKTAVLLLGTLVVAVLGLGLPRLEPRASLERDLPADSTERRMFDRLEALFGLTEPLIVVIESQIPGREFELKSIAELYAQNAADKRFVGQAAYRVDQIYESYHLNRNAPEFVNLLTVEDGAHLRRQLTPERLRETVARFRLRWLAPSGEALHERLRADALGLFGPIRERILSSLAPFPLASEDSYFLSADGRSLALILTPHRPSADLLFALRLVDFLGEVERVVLDTPEQRRSFAIHLVGPHAQVAAEWHLLRFDLLRGGLVGAIILFAFGLVAFRRAAAIVILGVPVAAVAIALAGLAGFLLDGVTVFALAAYLLALTAAAVFSVHLYSRYIEEASVPNAVFLTAMARAAAGTGRTNLKLLAGSLVVVAAAFLGDMRAWRSFALVGLAGLGLAWLAAHLLVPALASLIVARRTNRAVSRRFTNFGLRYFANAGVALPHLVLALAVMLTCYLGWNAVTIRTDMESLWRDSGTREYRARVRRADQLFDLAGARALVAIEGDDLQTALALNDRLYDALRTERPAINASSIVSVRNLLPSLASQQAAREEVLALTLDAVEQTLRSLAAEHSLNYHEVFAPQLALLARLQEAARTHPYLQWGAIARSRYVQLIRQAIHRPGRRHVILTAVYLKGPDLRSDIAALRRTVRNVAPGAVVTARMLLRDEVRAVVQRDVSVLLFLGALTIVLLAVAFLGGRRWLEPALAPAFVSALGIVGTLALLEERLSFSDLVILPTLVFVALASTLHIVQRFRENLPNAQSVVVREDFPYTPRQRTALFSAVHTGRPSTVVAGFLFLAFAMLIPAEHAGLHRLGVVGALSLLFVQVTVQTLLPALLTLGGIRRALALRPFVATPPVRRPREVPPRAPVAPAAPVAPPAAPTPAPQAP